MSKPVICWAVISQKKRKEEEQITAGQARGEELGMWEKRKASTHCRATTSVCGCFVRMGGGGDGGGVENWTSPTV